MALKIGVVSQKGGVGKSTLARMIACEYAASGWEVKIADMDLKQSTSYEWQQGRLASGTQPAVSVEQFSSISRSLRTETTYDLLVFDSAPHATKRTLEIAEVCDLVIIPTGLSRDDLVPTIKLAHELTAEGISTEKVAIALCKVGHSLLEIEETRVFIRAAGYHHLNGTIPESTGYRRAQDIGRSITETRYSSLNEKAGQVMQAIVDCLEELTTLQTA